MLVLAMQFSRGWGHISDTQARGVRDTEGRPSSAQKALGVVRRGTTDRRPESRRQRSFKAEERKGCRRAPMPKHRWCGGDDHASGQLGVPRQVARQMAGADSGTSCEAMTP